MKKINISYIDPIGEYISYQDLIEDQRERIQELESLLQEFLMTVDHGAIDPCVIVLDFEAKFKQLLEA